MSGAGLQQPHYFWLPLLIIAGLAVLTAWLGQLAHTGASEEAEAVGHDPDYFVEDFQATAFGLDGVARYRLSASRMVHYMDDDSTTLDAPRFEREGPGVSRVRAESRRGLVSSTGENVYFIGDVRMEQDGAGGREPLRLHTEYLWVIPERNVIRTDKQVTLREGRSVVTAAGMVADGDQRSLVLTGRVKGIYENRH